MAPGTIMRHSGWLGGGRSGSVGGRHFELQAKVALMLCDCVVLGRVAQGIQEDSGSREVSGFPRAWGVRKAKSWASAAIVPHTSDSGDTDMIRISTDGRKAGNARGCYFMAGVLMTIRMILGVALGNSGARNDPHRCDPSIEAAGGRAEVQSGGVGDRSRGCRDARVRGCPMREAVARSARALFRDSPRWQLRAASAGQTMVGSRAISS